MLEIDYESLGEFEVPNPEMLPEHFGGKLCRLDINMKIGGRQVNLEVQVQRQGFYVDRTILYWARRYSSALSSGDEHGKLPQTIIISIVDFELFDCPECCSKFQLLETARPEILSEKMVLW